jgi:hypothetical protein
MFTAPLTDDALMSSSRLIRWLLRRRGTAPSTLTPSRGEVRPPALWGQADSVWTSLWQWLRADRPTEPKRIRTLEQARADFCVALNGLDSRQANDLRQRAGHARSLRELWHLRAELYSVIACHLSQGEADRRLALVNHHFSSGAHGTASASNGSRNGRSHHV